MAEYVATDDQRSLQIRLRQNQSWFKRTPGVFNSGRAIGFDDPDRFGWPEVTRLATSYKLALFSLVSKDTIFKRLKEHLGADWRTPHWLAYLGRPREVLEVSHARINENSLPNGWKVVALEAPSDQQIEAIQTLNAETGVSPYPAYFSRGEAAPIVAICVFDAAGKLKATSSGVMRYHPQSRLSGYLFAGMVSVDSDARGLGLGKFANATLMVESHTRFSWKVVQEQASPNNLASIAMINSCGLTFDENLVSVAAIDLDEPFTR